MGGNLLDTVVRINFRGSNFRGTRVRASASAIGADDVIWKLVHVVWWPKYSFNDIALHCIPWVRRYFVSKRHAGGQCWRRTNMLTREWQPYWSVCCDESYWLHFSSPGSRSISITTWGTTGDRGSCQSRTLSTGCRYSYEEPYSVLERRHLATCCTVRLWVENFMTFRWVTKIGTPRK